MYTLDRTAFEMKNQEVQSPSYIYWSKKTVEERLQAAYYLILCAYNCDPNHPPSLDRSQFNIKQRDE